MPWADLPKHVRTYAENNLTPREREAIRFELANAGIRRTAVAMGINDSSVRFYRLSAWAKIGKYLIALEQHREAA